jgi:hypothetical protein|tara:strand:+ start:48 stop:917 length:870 start_codon:yes stop_codon:yes gene_type:complete
MKANKLKLADIIDKHKGTAAVICGHGPSLNEDKERIEELQNNNEIIRFSVNNWYDYFKIAPDYWVISNSQFSFPVMHEIMNKYKSPVLYSTDGDFSSDEYIQSILQCDYLPYDQRHFKGHNCVKILKSFKDYQVKNKNFDYKEYGNNSAMWHPPRIGYPDGWAGFDLHGRCCKMIDRTQLTIQEELQKQTGLDRHYSTGDTVALHAIAFAILMGCSPIYLSGVDLSYRLGYARKDIALHQDHFTLWEDNHKNLISDLTILLDSANNKDIKIMNLNKQTWFDLFPISELP